MGSFQQDLFAGETPRIMFHIFCAISVVLSPLMMVTVISGQVGNPFSASNWEMPAADSNPLNLRNPLPFGHFGAQICIVSGAGLLVASLWTGWRVFEIGITSILVGLGWFLGLLWSIRIAGDKVHPRTGRPKLFGR